MGTPRGKDVDRREKTWIHVFSTRCATGEIDSLTLVPQSRGINHAFNQVALSDLYHAVDAHSCASCIMHSLVALFGSKVMNFNVSMLIPYSDVESRSEYIKCQITSQNLKTLWVRGV